MTLGEFTGLLLTDLLQARRMSDDCASTISEEYHADPLMKGIPVPHYTISEAELDVPVQVVGITRTELTNRVIDDLICRIDHTLPTLLYRAIKNAYYEKQEIRVTRAGGTPDPDQIGVTDGGAAQADTPSVIRLSDRPVLKASYKASTASICSQMRVHMSNYLKECNFSVFRLLDFSEAFSATLRTVCKQEFSTYPDSETPFLDKESLKAQCRIVGNRMFFEWKQLFDGTQGVLIEPESGKIGAHSTPDTLMHIRLKVREQDLDCIVDKDSAQMERFLSLN